MAHHAGLLPSSTSDSLTIDDVALEALRALCNALRLHEPARDTLANIPGVLERTLDLIKPPAPPPAHFLASRLLFLMTVGGGDVTRTLVDELHAADRLAEALRLELDQLSDPTNFDAQASLAEHLKFLHNLVVFYARLAALSPAGSSTSSRRPSSVSTPLQPQDSTTSPTLDSTPHSPASTVRKSIKGLFARASSTTTPTLSTNAMVRKGSRASAVAQFVPTSPPTPSPGAAPNFETSARTAAAFDSCLPVLVTLALILPATPPAIVSAPLSHALHALVELPVTSLWFMASPPIPTTASMASFSLLPPTAGGGPTSASPSLAPLPHRVLALLDAGTATFAASDPDDANLVRLRAQHEHAPGGDDPDAALAGLLLLLRKIVIHDAEAARAIKSKLLPDDMYVFVFSLIGFRLLRDADFWPSTSTNKVIGLDLWISAMI